MNADNRDEQSDPQLSAAVRRIAGKDVRAFARLHERLYGPTLRHVNSLLADPHDVEAVMSATFYEVWWLAPAHNSDGLDVAAWVRDISIRRAQDRRQSPGRPHEMIAAVDVTIALQVADLIAQGSAEPAGRAENRTRQFATSDRSHRTRERAGRRYANATAEGGGVEPQFLRGTG
jgi:DNA-directed RNA polymerase specialized sigma24 family protein